ncbi:ATP-binding protein [Streptomyces sp. NPDC059533]|uniref:ATP-binding protein n=1 Tax=unclassified Streptomyces TaxID=2593676 RepID=UPI0036A0C80C
MEVHEVTLPVTGTPEGAASARRQVMNEVRGWHRGFGDDGLHSAEAVAGELLANAVQHTSGGGASVTARLQEGRLRVEVCDQSAALPHERRPRTDAEDGRGLLIIAALADRHGVEQNASGKSCWAEFDLPVSPFRAR